MQHSSDPLDQLFEKLMKDSIPDAGSKTVTQVAQASPSAAATAPVAAAASVPAAAPAQSRDCKEAINRCGPKKCLCERDLTEAELKVLFPNLSAAKVEEFTKEFAVMMKRYQITTCLRKAHFLAQIGHESGDLKARVENISEEEAMTLHKGYQGRGLMQLTGKKNYTQYGKHVGINFLRDDTNAQTQEATKNNPKKLESPPYHIDVSGWFWMKGKGPNLNQWADTNDLIRVTQEINGGLNGYEDRRKRLKKAWDVLMLDQCKSFDHKDPKFQKNAFDTPLETIKNSSSYDIPIQVFAWGYWHDRYAPSQKGTLKNDAEKEQAYARVRELEQQKKVNTQDRFRISAQKIQGIYRGECKLDGKEGDFCKIIDGQYWTISELEKEKKKNQNKGKK